ncbi:MAG: hypothetical protein Q4C22_04620 [Bacillota bacterium]|nr:hypothetical protein [Bacillota bacterium]
MANFNLDSFILYDNVRTDEAVETGVRIFNEFFYREYISYMETDYFQLQRLLLKAVGEEETEGSYWQNHICRLAARSANRFSLEASAGRDCGALMGLALKEIASLKALYHFDWERVAAAFGDSHISVCCAAPAPQPGSPLELVRKALTAETDQESMDFLYEYYKSHGVPSPAEGEPAE